jgi:four helix bundle protein
METKQRKAIPDFKELICWKKGMELAKVITPLTYAFPQEHDGLGDQLRRCSLSVPSNIAEGRGRYRGTTVGYILQFLVIALGSLNECETQVILAIDFGLLTDESLLSLIGQTRTPLQSLIAELTQYEK